VDKFKALVVDDEESVCTAIKEILEPEDFVVTTTLSSPAAVDLARQNSYDLIISDLKMPDLDGMQLYEKVREIESKSIFMLVTAYHTLDTAVEAVNKGIYECLEKPFTPDEMRLPVRQRLKLLRERSSAGGKTKDQTN